ncbi:uracil-DNA glycosylase [Marinomonas mediterranea]|uniref:uracil-DNA glycosylase n=1 Tax=Marinomonas mediterranea TaxID=119864 RepID=UPI00234B2F88|nr:uracil-DNA glycosylase [Marinomonas mediterranea]WCN10568.1 uracil-DNA glycosylase [Marinomonas mediterranea]
MLNLTSDWFEKLAPEFEKDYMLSLTDFLDSESQKGQVIYPEAEERYTALNCTSFDNVKVVILGQDPYHGPDQAHGLSFSVKPGIKVPPSLVNIYKELESDLGIPVAQHGYLESWANQGVLLLNSVLTVEASKAGAHQKKGWETFTDRIVTLLNKEREGIVFLLWGSYAQKKGKMIDRSKHLVLESVHPSPLSAYRGFFGCRHFSETNTYLKQTGQAPIDWAAHL